MGLNVNKWARDRVSAVLGHLRGREVLELRDISSSAQALATAEWMAHRAAKHESGELGVWLTVAAPPLAALLFAASRCGNDRGMPWVRSVVNELRDPYNIAGWSGATMATAKLGGGLHESLTRLTRMDGRQRASVGHAIWTALGAEHGEVLRCG